MSPSLVDLPKVELHVHLDGSVRAETLLALADAQGVDLGASNLEALNAALKPGRLCDSLVDYLRTFEWTLKVLQRADALERVAYELAEDNAREQVLYLEVRFAPFLHTEAGLSEEAVVEAVLAGLRRAEAAYPALTSRLILCGLRHLDPEVTLRMAQLAARYQDQGVCGLDLAGPEAGFPPDQHAAAYDFARDAGLGLTVHAGEAAGPESVRLALDRCHATRLGHGCALQDDAALRARVAEAQIGVESCPSSNVQTRAVSSLDAHPLASFLKEGLLVSLNTDNRYVTATTQTAEWERTRDALSLDRSALRQLGLAGARTAFLPDSERKALMQRYTTRFDAAWPG